MRILIVEDDDRIAKPLAEDLENQRYVVDCARDGISGLNHAQAIEYELILLDIMLPGIDGISLCKKLRASGFGGFILMLTAKDTTSDKVIGLDAGADDYLVKPFELEELAARIRALSRRPSQIQSPILRQGKLVLNPATRTIKHADMLIPLTPKEYLILEHLMNHPGQVFTKSAILDKLWNADCESGEGTIKTHINNLRQKIREAGSDHNYITTIYGVGYRLNTPNR